MINPQLADYISHQRGLGKNDADIRQALIASGWPEGLINEGLGSQAGGPMPPPISSVRTELPGIGQLFRESFELAKQRILIMFVSGILPFLGLLGAVILGGIIWFVFNRLSSVAGGIIGVLLFIALFCAYVYIILWVGTAFIVALRDAPEKTGIMENLKRSRKLIWSFLLVGILVNLIVTGGMVLLIVPGIMFMVWYSSAPMIMVTEGKKGRLALAQSKAYVLGRSWPVFGRILLMYLAYYVPYILLQILGAVFKSDPIIYIPTVILTFCLAFFGTFYILAFTYTLYRHIRDSAGPTEPQKYVGGVTGWAIWGGVGGVLIFIGFLGAIVLLALNSARSLSRDAKRLADVRMISSAEELYYNDNGSYSQNLEDLTPKYIVTGVPVAPTPADGSCTADQNDYHYTLSDSEHFKLTFCLGKATSVYSAGPHTVTESGVEGEFNQIIPDNNAPLPNFNSSPGTSQSGNP